MLSKPLRGKYTRYHFPHVLPAEAHSRRHSVPRAWYPEEVLWEACPSREATSTLNSICIQCPGFSIQNSVCWTGRATWHPATTPHGYTVTRHRHVLRNALSNMSEKSVRMLKNYFMVWRGKLQCGMCRRIPFFV